MCVLSIKLPIRKKSGNLFNDPRIKCNVVKLVNILVPNPWNPTISIPAPLGDKCSSVLCSWEKRNAVISIPRIQNCFPGVSRYNRDLIKWERVWWVSLIMVAFNFCRSTVRLGKPSFFGATAIIEYQVIGVPTSTLSIMPSATFLSTKARIYGGSAGGLLYPSVYNWMRRGFYASSLFPLSLMGGAPGDFSEIVPCSIRGSAIDCVELRLRSV